MGASDEFIAAFDRLLDEEGMAVALSVATSIFVGLVEAATRSAGHDTSGNLFIDGGNNNRDITIHAEKK